MTEPENDLLVVGGGIGGLAAALALARVGRKVVVLEAAPAFGEIGAGIQLAPNATQVLDQLGLLDQVLEFAFLPRALIAMDALSGERITTVDLSETFQCRYSTPYVVLHRSDLHTILLRACEREPDITLRVGRQVTRVDIDGHMASVSCVDGSTYAARGLVGADGLHSVVRPLISGDQPITDGFVAYRGALPMADVDMHELQDSMVYWWGPNLHLVQYKVRRGELYNQVGVFRTDGDDRGVVGNGVGESSEFDRVFGGCCETVRQGAARLRRDARWVMIDRDPLTSWSLGPVTLLGDAAHPMLQYIAQGGCQALEDARALAASMSSHTRPADAFHAYQAERIPRTSRVVRTARSFGELIHIGGVGAAVRNRLLASRPDDDFSELDWLYRPRLATPTRP